MRCPLGHVETDAWPTAVCGLDREDEPCDAANGAAARPGRGRVRGRHHTRIGFGLAWDAGVP